MLFEVDVIPHLGIHLLKYQNNPFSSRGRAGHFNISVCGNANLWFRCSGVNREPGDNRRAVIQLPEEC